MRSILRLILTSMGITLAFPVLAQEIVDLSEIVKGQKAEWQTNNGTLTNVYIGKEKGLYKFKYHQTVDGGKDFGGNAWVRKDGQLVKYDYDSYPGSINFKPHNCGLTVGRCEFVYEDTEYGSYNSFRETTYSNGVWSFKTYAQKENGEYGLQEIGSFSVDSFGWETFFKSKTYYGGKEKKRTLKRIK